MAIGPQDNIDRLLVKKYSNEKVDNSAMNVMVDQKKMLETMNDYALMHKNMLALNQRLKEACSALNSKTAAYKSRRRVSQAK